MKGFKGAVFLVAGLLTMALTTVAARSATIASISHNLGADGRERVTFTLSEPRTPKVFTIKGESPRLVLDFSGTTYRGKNTIALAEGKLALAVRLGVHQEPELKVRAVIDLAKDIPVVHALAASDNPNLLVVELTGPTGAESPAVTAKAETQPAAAASQPALEPAQPVAKVPAVAEKSLPVPAATAEKAASPPVPAESVGSPPVAVPAEKVSGLPRLRNISFDDSSAKGEMVLFHLNGFHPPAVSAVEKDNPRVFCDFVGMELDKGVEPTIAAKGKFVESIRVSKQGKPEKIRATLHLVPNRDYDLQQVFFKSDNLFVLIVNELPPAKSP